MFYYRNIIDISLVICRQEFTMALYFNDPVSQVVYDNEKYFDENIRALSDRQIRWIRRYLSKNVHITFDSIVASNMKEDLIRRLAGLEDFKKFVQEAIINMSKEAIPDEEFTWLYKDFRAQILFINFLSRKYGYVEDNINDNDLLLYITNILDSDSKTHLFLKTGYLTKVRNFYLSKLKNENYIKWLDLNNIKQVLWVKEYLLKNNSYFNLGEKNIGDYVLASLDAIDMDYLLSDQDLNDFTASSHKILFIDKMKRAWSQQKYRDAGKTKTQYHLALTKQTKKRLSKMAEVKGLSETALLDILINSEYQLRFLDLDGKDIY